MRACKPRSDSGCRRRDVKTHARSRNLPSSGLLFPFAMIEHCQRLMHENMKDADDNILHMVAIAYFPLSLGATSQACCLCMHVRMLLKKGYTAMAFEATGRASQRGAEKVHATGYNFDEKSTFPTTTLKSSKG